MRIGTKSLLFGCHQFLLHPLFVLAAWCRLWGWPSWRMLVAIVIHDWGYWGCESMDGEDGGEHPKAAAFWCFDHVKSHPHDEDDPWALAGAEIFYHSRYLSRQYGQEPSRLCWADKLGTAWYPTWLWVALARLSGELQEYMDDTKYEIHHAGIARQGRACEFFRRYKAKVAEWITELESPE